MKNDTTQSWEEAFALEFDLRARTGARGQAQSHASADARLLRGRQLGPTATAKLAVQLAVHAGSVRLDPPRG